MKVLVTGNMGYIGPAVVERLRAAFPDSELVGLDTGFFAHCLTGTTRLPETRLDRQVFADVRTVPGAVFDGVDAVVHLAAISNDPMGNAFEQVTVDINCDATVRVARIAKKAGVRRFVFASSCSVYGAAAGAPRSEEDAVSPLTAYARSKVGAESALCGLASDGFAVTCLRFATACGMTDRLRLDLVLNDFVAAAIASRKIDIFSDGTPWRPLINVRDMARAIEWGITRRADNGGAFLSVNVGSDDFTFQVKELADAVTRAVPGVRVSVNENAAPDKRSYRVDFSKFQRLAPRHQPQISVEETIRDLMDGLAAMRFEDADFHKSQLIRLNVLRQLREQNRLNAALEWLA